MDKVSTSDESESEASPSPADFDKYLPWAYSQFQIEARIHIIRNEQTNLSSPFVSSRIKARKSAKYKEDTGDASPTVKLGSAPVILYTDAKQRNVININTFYDQNDKLCQLKLLKNSSVPRDLLKIISIILPFHPRLTTIKIDGGLKQDGLYEISKILSVANISEIILDDNVMLEANYYLLLDGNNTLKYLSLGRCKINDNAVKLIASKLVESSLSILNLTSNRITDLGATYLGDVLRCNRKLTYLNLADNMITDTGAIHILNSLMPFPLNAEEITHKKVSHFGYLKQKNDLVQKIYDELRGIDVEKKVISTKKKPVKLSLGSATKKIKTLEKEYSTRPLQSVLTIDAVLFEKAEKMATASLGSFKDPFDSDNIVTKEEVLYCLGNNVLCYLNLAYNNLSYFSVKRLHEVLSSQADAKRAPRGLVNVCIEGNNLPESCYELMEIDLMLQIGLAASRRISTMLRRRSKK